jgi:hypothetical protein
MEPHNRPENAPPSGPQASPGPAREARSTALAGTGAEAYPYDPALRPEQQQGLDRLRCIEDRRLAAELYELYVHAEHNQQRRTRAPGSVQPRGVQGMQVIARRALAGEFGCDARELAEYVLLDDAGRERMDGRSLREFALCFRKLRGR